MNGSILVDVSIGLVLLYLILALFCTAVQEWIAQLFSLRAKHLHNAIKVLLSGSTASNADANAVLEHPLVKMLGVKPGAMTGARDRAYIPAKNFADALTAQLVPTGQVLNLASLKAGINALQNADAKTALTTIVDRAEASQTVAEEQVRAVLSGIEGWYDSAMDHATGWYRRNVRWILLAIASTLTIVVNADTIQIGWLMAGDAQLRDSVAAMAARVAPVNDPSNTAFKKLEADVTKHLNDRDLRGAFGPLPVGWSACGCDLWSFNCELQKCYPPGSTSSRSALFLKLAGLLATAMAAALGAPFWFGLLQQLNAIRAAGPRPVSSTSAAPTA